MKMTSDIKKFIFNRVYKIILRFQDEREIAMEQIIDWDFDFDQIDESCIDFTNAIVDKEIFDRFSTDDNIILLHIEGKSVDMLAINDNVVMMDVPCNMHIRKVRINGSFDTAANMNVQLEGMVW